MRDCCFTSSATRMLENCCEYGGAYERRITRAKRIFSVSDPMRKLVVVVSCLCAAGCARSPFPVIEAQLGALKGKPVQGVADKLGPPNKQAIAGDEKSIPGFSGPGAAPHSGSSACPVRLLSMPTATAMSFITTIVEMSADAANTPIVSTTIITWPKISSIRRIAGLPWRSQRRRNDRGLQPLTLRQSGGQRCARLLR